MNIISENDFMRLKDKPKLVTSDIRLYPFAANHPLPVIGKFTGTLRKYLNQLPSMLFRIPKEGSVTY